MKMIFRNFFVSFIICVAAPTSYAQMSDSAAILHEMQQQENAWNAGLINQYMDGYWRSDSLMFIGKSGITYGYNNTLNNYKKGYPDTTAMGKLHFDILEIKPISPAYYFVVGKWFLKRSIGDIGGHFSLIFKKINGRWRIIADHSS